MAAKCDSKQFEATASNKPTENHQLMLSIQTCFLQILY
jgi:hypothetical protein